jgi:hypothetical protein
MYKPGTKVTYRTHRTHLHRDYPSILYGIVKDAITDELLICATDEYCQQAIKERGWKIVRMSTEEGDS